MEIYINEKSIFLSFYHGWNAYFCVAEIHSKSINNISTRKVKNMKTKRKILSLLMALCMALMLTPMTVLASDPDTTAEQDVAEVDGARYTTLKAAIAAATDGSTVNLLSDVKEDVTFDKNITIDGGNKYTIFGVSTVKAGTLTNLTLKPNESRADGKLLTLGSGTETAIILENVTVHYSVTNRSTGSAMTVSGNKSNITINNCHFIKMCIRDSNKRNVWIYDRGNS